MILAMTVRKAPEADEEKPLPKTPIELAGWSIREFGFAAVLAVFVFLQWQADQARTARMETIMISNAEVLRSNSATMESLREAWKRHDERAQEFIERSAGDLSAIRAATSRSTP
jgi:hypothetical protein